MLQEKESLLDEAAAVFREAERAHSVRQETFASEKADVEAELEVRVHDTTRNTDIALDRVALDRVALDRVALDSFCDKGIKGYLFLAEMACK